MSGEGVSKYSKCTEITCRACHNASNSQSLDFRVHDWRGSADLVLLLVFVGGRGGGELKGGDLPSHIYSSFPCPHEKSHANRVKCSNKLKYLA